MKILAFSDLHCDLEQAARLSAMSEEADLVVGAGDFASVHSGLGETIDALSGIQTPTVLVPGNNGSTSYVDTRAIDTRTGARLPLSQFVPADRRAAQLPLFTPPARSEEIVAGILRELDLERLTPLAALNLLASLKDRLR